MGLDYRPIRKLVRRERAERYMLLVLLCLAGTVSFTRFFLELSGYPQIGNSELHIAHVLWGGLLLFAGALLPLIYANRTVFDLSAILAGVGMGLFIDEVGKFITQSNDYFFPAAAPIVYMLFLMTLWVYLLVRSKQQPNPRSLLYEVFSMLGEYLDKDFSEIEKNKILEQLALARALDTEGEYGDLVNSIEGFLLGNQIQLVAHQDDFLSRFLKPIIEFEETHLPERRFRRLLVFALGLWGLITVANPFISILLSSKGVTVSGLWAELINTNLPLLTESSAVLLIRLFGEILVGVILLVCAFFLCVGKKRIAVHVAHTTLLISICGLYFLVFYFDQFSAIVYVLIQFIVFTLVSRYKHKICAC